MATPCLEQVITDLVAVFKKYVGDEGAVSAEQLKELIEKELSQTELKEKIPADDLERAMGFIDKNHDGEVNFNEFTRCVVCLAKGYYKKTGKTSKGGKGQKGKGDKGSKGVKKEDDDE